MKAWGRGISKVIADTDGVQKKRVYHICKRVFDLIMSVIALVVLWPVFLVIAIAIKVDDPHGGVFYSQTRIGKDGRQFKMFKFRSMVTDADKKLKTLLKYNEIDGPMFKMKEDPRITRVGKFIRKHSLDELPQLVNVLLGDMSLVGPRPPLPREVKEYGLTDVQRLAVVPGCTGLWQISGRNNVSFDTMVALDLKYIREANIWVDFVILLKTFRIIISPNDAY
ncbi:sugar transferase [Levilactobacillus koreensis]|uniref:Multidrug MFS transporter n=1 Tax=Levilactobacillus koreensis TaxID=637971 RepID=A0AAC8UWI1_9LACO|nr:sugar transferase [Levilactobacillus koreensis]AKP65321.1 multidrug MFS transporter [Levilactobacillus koreensis]